MRGPQFICHVNNTLLWCALQAHAAKSKQEMTAFEKYDQPQLKVVVTPNKQALGKAFKRQAKAVQDVLEQMQVWHAPNAYHHKVLQSRLPAVWSCPQ